MSTEIIRPERSHLWLTSRSTFERGTQHCPFARFVEYHAGNYGYGFSRKAMSLPLVTGTYAHLPITEILQWCLDARLQNGVQPDSVPDEVVRWAVDCATEKYDEVVNKRGILKYAADDPDSLAKLLFLIQEQKFLIEGLTWAWVLLRLPAYLAEYLIVAVEEEEEYVLDCTCGIGDGIGTFAEHEQAGCTGIGFQSKPDVLGQRKSDDKYGYTEFKTSSIANKAQNESWERKQQFILGILGAERRHGVEVSHAWVETLVKGKREREYPYSSDQPKIQRSPHCYAYYCGPQPPTVAAQWRPAYNYYTSEGLKYTADKKAGYKNTPIWTIPEAEGWEGKPEGMSVPEYWAKAMLQDYPTHLQKSVHLVGPLPKNHEQIQKALRSLVAEENLWRDRLWKIYDFGTTTGTGWGDDNYMEFVETVVPRSWHCDPFADHPCPNQVICHPVTEDWRDPVGSELFVYRTPHHLPELEQIKERGLVPPEAALAQESGELEDAE